MLNDTTESYASQKASNYDKIFKQNHRLQFADSLKDLKNLRKQLYSAAERFESSYDKNYQKQFVVQLSKDYIAKALVSTVDHLGSVADKLNKFLDEKANEFSATIIRFYCIEQRLSTFHEFIDTRGMSQQLLMIEATEHPKHYILPASKTSPFRKPKEVFRSSISSPPYNEQQPKQVVTDESLECSAVMHEADRACRMMVETGKRLAALYERLAESAKSFAVLDARFGWISEKV